MTFALRALRFVFFAALIMGGFAFAQSVFSQGEVRYGTYFNGRFGYAVAVPLSHLQPQGETNGDGQVFASDSGEELRVFGSFTVLGDSLAGAYDLYAQDAPGRQVTYKVQRGDWFVVSGFEGDTVFYTKVMAHPVNGSFLTFTLRYDKSLKPTFDPITEEVARSFRALEAERQVGSN